MEARLQAREDKLGMDFCKLHHLISLENEKWEANFWTDGKEKQSIDFYNRHNLFKIEFHQMQNAKKLWEYIFL